jgi:hypothetical protein
MPVGRPRGPHETILYVRLCLDEVKLLKEAAQRLGYRSLAAFNKEAIRKLLATNAH